jgi:hypothetical protein
MPMLVFRIFKERRSWLAMFEYKSKLETKDTAARHFREYPFSLIDLIAE